MNRKSGLKKYVLNTRYSNVLKLKKKYDTTLCTKHITQRMYDINKKIIIDQFWNNIEKCMK